MGETVIERMERINAKYKISAFMVKEQLPYEQKVIHAKQRAREFVTECEMRCLNYHVSVGGLDSITLLMFLRSIHIDCPAISVSYLEDKSIQDVHKRLGVISLKSALRPYGTHWNKAQIIQEFGFPVPEIYGTIERRADGTLYTTKAQRTGCSMCGFGLHLEKRPHRFDLLKERNPKEWQYWLYECCTDEQTGEKYGWARVLDYIGVGY